MQLLRERQQQALLAAICPYGEVILARFSRIG
jgi:hypothetical protein